MSLDQVLRYLSQAIFLWVAANTIWIWLKQRDPARRDIALVFVALAVAIITQDLAQLLPRIAPLLNLLFLIALLAQPYFVLRVASYSMQVPAPVQRGVLIGLLACYVLIPFIPRLGPAGNIIIVIYFLIVETYSALLLLHGARLIRHGTTSRRLRLASLGSALLVLVFLTALIIFFLNLVIELPPSISSVSPYLVQFFGMVSGISYYFSFSPPRWMRRIWQLDELHDFLRASAGHHGQGAQVFEQLPQAARELVSAAGVAVARANADGSYASIQSSGEAPLLIEGFENDADPVGEAWRERSSRLVRLPGQVNRGILLWASRFRAQALYLIPLNGSLRPWGLLILALPHLPLFPNDDIELLDLISEQSVIQLDYSALVEKLRASNRSLHQRIAEQSLSEEKFRGLLEAAPDAMVIVDDKGVITMANAQAEKIFGYSRPQLIGKSIEVLMPTRSRPIHQHHRRGYVSEPGMRPMGIGLDLQGLRSDGSEFPVEISLSPLETPDGLLTIAAVRDITERRRAEQKFRGLLETAPDAIVVVNQDGVIQIVNTQTENLFGYDRAEILGQPIEVLIPKRFQKKHLKHREHYFEENHPARPMGKGLELFGVRKNGVEFPVEISLGPLEAEGELLISAAIRDVSQRKENEEEIRKLNSDLEHRASQLEAANKELESFSYSVSHDLRAPLRSIDGFSQALLEDYGGKLPADGRDYLERVRASAQRMAELIDDLLNLSRVTRSALNPRFINISDMAQDVITTLRDQAPEREVEVKITPDMMVTADPHLIRIVLDNLLNNAWKFTSKKEHAIIEFGQEGHDQVRTFYVRDNGVGFNMAYVDKLFGVFQRLHAMSEYPGTGVGLATVQRIIKIHGGRIWAESEEGKGTTFCFTL